MTLDHKAIRKAYPNAVVIDDGAGVFDADNKSITIDQNLVDAARTELDKLNYQGDRKYGTTSYGTWREQLAMLYDDMVAGKLDTTGTWATHIKAVKDANPKP